MWTHGDDDGCTVATDDGWPLIYEQARVLLQSLAMPLSVIEVVFWGTVPYTGLIPTPRHLTKTW